MTADGRRFALLAAPGLVLALAGLTHPHHLTYATSRWWTLLHLAGLVVFPLVGIALAALVSGRRDPLAGFVRATAYLYATAYTALDVISGVTAGYLTHRAGDVPRNDTISHVFAIGSPVGEVGSVALIACSVVLVGTAVVRYGVVAVPGLALVAGAYLVHVDHIFSPWGSLGMALVGLGTAWLGHLQGRWRHSSVASTPRGR